MQISNRPWYSIIYAGVIFVSFFRALDYVQDISGMLINDLQVQMNGLIVWCKTIAATFDV